jgi:DNA-(apurinic or apyrimidinic site) lyase
LKYHNDLEKLNKILAKTMWTKIHSKTIVFAIKMFGYAYTIISWKEINYPTNINIPVDSRLKKIYSLNTNKETTNEIEICKYFNKLSQNFNIPPLDLDTILRLDYRKTIK